MVILTSVEWYLIVSILSYGLWVLCISSLEKCMFQSFAHFLIGLFVFLVWSPVCSLYILVYLHALSKISLENIFSHKVGPLFILLMFSLAIRYFLFWWSPICLFFSFMSLAIWDVPAKIFLWEIDKILLAMFSSRILMASWLTFKIFIHSEFIHVDGLSGWSNFIFLHIPVQFSQHHLLKMLPLLHCMLLFPLSNTNWP